MTGTGHRWAIAALVWTIVIGIACLVVPVGSSGSVEMLSDGTEVVRSSTETLLQSEGRGVVVLLAVPVLLAGVAVAAGRLRRARLVRLAAGAVLMVGCMLGAASIGLFYAPAAFGLLLASAATPSATAPTDAS